MHDTSQLNAVCRRDEDISPHFLGVFAADKIPLERMKNLQTFSLIANTDPSNLPGQHWVAFMRKNGNDFFFDSYGMKPSSHFPPWRHFDGWSHNTMDLQQDESDVCGDYCIFFFLIFSSLQNPSFNKAFKCFDVENKQENDYEVFQISHNLYPKILNKVGHDTDGDGHYDLLKDNHQSCKSRKIKSTI